MRPDLDTSLLRDLAEPLVDQFSPGEAGELFPLLSEAHFADPGAYADPTRRAGPLAFGVPDLVVLLTPVALVAMTEVVRYVVDVGLRKGHQVGADALRRMLRRTSTPSEQTAPPEQAAPPTPAGPADPKAPAAPPAPAASTLELTAQEWSQVRRIVEQVALRGGVDADRAALIADAVVGRGQLGDGSP